MRAGRPGPRRAAGFTYFGALFLVVLLGLALAGTGLLWSAESQRARERELLWVGQQYLRALQSYHRRSPGARQYPARLEDLLLDPRFPQPVRHLRQLYPDPVARSLDWGLVHNADGRIAGIYSRAEGRPFRQANFPLALEDLAGARSYRDWRFVADPALRGAPAAAP